MPAFCLVVVQGLVCFGLDRSQHDSLFWIDLAHLIPAFLPLFWFHRHSRRRRRLLERRPDLKSELPLRWPIIILVLSGVIFGLAAGLAAIPRLSTTLAASTTYTLDR